MKTYVATRAQQTQTLFQGDILDDEVFDAYRAVIRDGRVGAVYSDPPWNPGNGTYWRTHAGLEPRATYDAFCDAWVRIVALCQQWEATDVLVEQSANADHQNLLRAAIRRSPDWVLVEQQVYPVLYGSGSKLLPNALIHFGGSPLRVSPEGCSGEVMTFRVFSGLRLGPGEIVVDPCTGRGMTSRAAHIFGLDFIGSELNPARLDITLKWLKKQGYSIVESGP